MSLPKLENCKIAILGLGYVGLPLAIEFARKFANPNFSFPNNGKIIGFDIDRSRINQLINNFDKTDEVDEELLNQLSIQFTYDEADLLKADVYIVTVPTPIDKTKRPDITLVKDACKIIGRVLKKRSAKTNTCPIVIFESTVYPGLTEEVCVTIIEKISGLKYNEISKGGFVCGYSPERINPGDKEHTLTNIVKITSGSNQEAADWIDSLYKTIIIAGTYKCSSIKEAEAAKVIENTQRDLNIALINELAIIFSRMNINTRRVLKAAGTKWNFLNFQPGLVGGHCIGVDPYYLTYKSEQCGYVPEIVLAGRRINDNMGKWVIDQLVLSMAKNSYSIGGCKLLILGFTFKENCKDIRNTQIISLYQRAKEYSMEVDILDPMCDKKDVKLKYGIDIYEDIVENKKYDALIVAVAHQEFKDWAYSKWESIIKKDCFIYDLKDIAPRNLRSLSL